MLSVSAVVLLGIAVLITIRKNGHRLWHAALATLFGFYLAQTSIAPAIARAVSAVVTAFARIRL